MMVIMVVLMKLVNSPAITVLEDKFTDGGVDMLRLVLTCWKN